METRMKDFIYQLGICDEPAWIVRQMGLSGGEATGLAIKVSSYLDDLQLEAARYERFKRLDS